jgi:hypothetical protein
LEGIRDDLRFPVGSLSFTTVYFYSKAPVCQGCRVSKIPCAFQAGLRTGEAIRLRRHAAEARATESSEEGRKMEEGGGRTEDGRRRMEE